MAELFLGVMVQVLLEKLVSGGVDQIVQYVKGKKIDPKTIEKLKNSLRKIAAMLRDAQQRRIQSEEYKIWVEDLQDLAYDLEDLLDELLTADHQLLHQQGVDNQSKVPNTNW